MVTYTVALLLLLGRIVFSLGAEDTVVSGSLVELTGRVERHSLSEGKQSIWLSGYTIWAPVYPRVNFGDNVRVNGSVYCLHDAYACPTKFIKADRLEVREAASDEKLMLSPIEMFAMAHRRATSVYRIVLPEEQADLVSGIVFGGNSLSSDYKSKLADVGLSHVVAASGMNVTFFAGLSFSLLSVFRARKGLVVLFGSILVWLYCGIAGFEAPVVRAGLMVTLTLFAQAFGRNLSSWWGLGLAGYIMLWVNPELVSDFGFLLSFSSMIGQITVSSVQPRLRIAWKFIAQSLIQNVASILATIPIVVWLFGRLSLVTIFTNVLVVWTIEPLMILGILAVILGILSYELAEVVLLPAGILLGYFNFIVDFFASVPWSVMRVENPGWWFLIGYYMFFGGLVLYFKQYHRRQIRISSA